MSDLLMLPRLVAVTRPWDLRDDILLLADPHDPLAWLRHGDGIVGIGPDVLRIDVGEDGRLEAIADVWRGIAAATDVDDEVRLPGTGLVAFGAFAFDDRSDAASTLVIPSVIVGRRDGRTWLTTIRREEADVPVAPAAVALGPRWSSSLQPGALSPAAHGDAVRQALDAIDAGRLEKVIVARDLQGSAPADADLRRLVRTLADAYPDTWTYAVDGLVGASPETLVRVSHGTVTARVLAGTRPRAGDGTDDDALAAELTTSRKDLHEHRFAVESVLASLRPHTSSLTAAEAPFPLRLPNVWHLATDVEGSLSQGGSALDMVRALHPTAAVAGTPTETAYDVIREIEPFDRGRYAGPVGWIDGTGDGEWAIALRGAQFGPPAQDERPFVAHAGGGIVAGSDPDAELLETEAKFHPIADALS